LMSALYARIDRGPGSIAWQGVRFGAAVGVLWLMPYSLVLFGVYRFPYEALSLDVGWALVEQGAGGLVVALIQGRTR
jgi:hypothetical protein